MACILVVLVAVHSSLSLTGLDYAHVQAVGPASAHSHKPVWLQRLLL